MSFDRTARKPGDVELGRRGGAGGSATPGKRTLTSSLPPAAPDKTASRDDQHAADVADLVVQGKPSEALLETTAGPAAAASTATPVVQRQQTAKKPAAGSCNIPFPRVEYDSPDGTICRRFDGTTTYSMVTKAQLAASGYKFWVTDGVVDKWVKIDRSSELWVQLPKINAATSEKAISQLGSIIATRKRELDDLEGTARAMNSPDPDVASAAKEEWDKLSAEFPGFDDDYALVPALRDQVDVEHRKAFEDSVKALMEQRDRWDPQSTYP